MPSEIAASSPKSRQITEIMAAISIILPNIAENRFLQIMPVWSRTHNVRMSYAFLSYVALNMPAYDKNAQMSYVGMIAYDMSYVDCTVSVRVCTSPKHTQSTGPPWGAIRVGGKGAMLAHRHLRLQYRTKTAVHRDADDVHTRAVVWAHRTTCVQMPYDSDMWRTYSVRMSYVMVTVTKV